MRLKTQLTLLALFVGLGAAPHARADLIAGWNFNDTSDFPDSSLAVSHGSGTLTTNWATANLTDATGSTINAFGGDPAGRDISFQNGGTTGNPANEGNWLEFEISMTGLADLVMTYAGRTTNTGMRELTWSYSTDGTSFTNHQIVDHVALFGSGNYGLVTVDFSSISALNGAEEVFIRGTFATLSGQSNPTAAGSNRFDNFQFNALPTGGETTLIWTGAGGEWDTTTAAWEDEEPNDTIWNNTANANTDATFTGEGALTVAVDASGITAGSLRFDTDGYVIEGPGELELTTGVARVSEDGDSATVAADLAGDNGLTKTGAGRLLLGGDNSFEGNVTIAGGVLAIGADNNLGNTGNDLIFNGGGLELVDSVSLAVGRSLAGTGGIIVPAGEILEIGGTVNMGLTLAGGGAVAFNGTSSVLTQLTLEDAMAIDGEYIVSGTVLATHTDGTTVLDGFLDLAGAGARVFDIADGANAVDMEIAADITSGFGNRLEKRGEGTLLLSGDNTGLTAGVRLGVAGGVTGGRLIAANPTVLGSTQFFLNHGVFEAQTPLTGANAFTIGVSIGGREGSVAVLAGEDMEFMGESEVFQNATQENRFDVNNTTTLSGDFTLGGPAGIALTIGGTGHLVVTGDASGMQLGTTLIESVMLSVLNSAWGAALLVGDNATLSGAGSDFLETVTVAGTHAPGASAGVQTFQDGLNYLDGSNLEWELFGNTTAGPGSNFDQIHLAGGDLSIQPISTLSLIFDADGSTVDWTDAFWNLDRQWTLVSNTGGGDIFGMFNLSGSGTWFDSDGMLLGDVRPDAFFSLGQVGDDMVLFYAPIPEPGIAGLLILAGGAYLLRRRHTS